MRLVIDGFPSMAKAGEYVDAVVARYGGLAGQTFSTSKRAQKFMRGEVAGCFTI